MNDNDDEFYCNTLYSSLVIERKKEEEDVTLPFKKILFMEMCFENRICIFLE